MTFGRSIALGFALLLAAGCSGGSSSTTPAPWPPPQQPQSKALYPQDSSAAKTILANVGSAAARAPQGWTGDGDHDADDGDLSTLVLPKIVSCGDGTYSTDCSLWRWGSPTGTRSVARGGLALSGINGTAPSLNFCRDALLYPSDLGAPATPIFGGSLYGFTLTYLGTKQAPIVGFATRWWNVSFSSGFTGTSKTGNVTLSPTLTNGASRGWLAFFTWSWPADVMLVPYAINEIQLNAASSPLAVPANGSAQLGAFDCLGRPIAATRFGSGFGFNPAQASGLITSAAAELNAPVYGGRNPNGLIYLSDDKGARTVTTVAPATPGPTSVPTTAPTAAPTTPPTNR